MDLATRIAAWMQYRGFTQRHVADEIGVVPSTVSMWCSGDATPRGKHLDALIELVAESHALFYGPIPARRAS